MASNGDLFKGFILGGLVGAAIGVLFAPKSGKDTREELMEESDDLLSKAKDELEKVKNDLGDLRTRITATVNKSKKVFEEAATAEERDFEAEISSVDEEKTEAKKQKRKKRTTKTKPKKTNES
jgi:gas vesicle protein